MDTFPVMKQLPPEYLSGIGQVCFEWAMVERSLAIITYEILNIGPKHGRVAVRSRRAHEQLETIRELMQIDNIDTPQFDLDDLAKDLRDIGPRRDKVAHGIWLKNTETGDVMLQDLGGNWRPDPKGPKVSKRIIPMGSIVPPEYFANLVEAIQIVGENVEMFGRELKKIVQSLREKSPQQYPGGRPLDDPNLDTSEPQQKPSRP